MIDASDQRELRTALGNLNSRLRQEDSSQIDLESVCFHVESINRIKKPECYNAIFQSVFDFEKTSIIIRSIRILLERGCYTKVFELWLFCVESGGGILAIYILNNKHLFERIFIRSDEIFKKYGNFRDIFAKYNFGIRVPDRSPILVCGMPKSGSTSLSSLMSSYSARRMADGHNRNGSGHALDIDHLRPLLTTGSVIHCHLRPTVDFICLIKCLGLRPVVILRNIFAAIESRHRHDAGAPLRRMFSSPDELRLQNELEFSVYQHAFEYVTFAQQWLKAAPTLPVRILYFEDNIKNWGTALQRAVTHVQNDYDEARGEQVVRAYEEDRRTNSFTYRISDIADGDRIRFTDDLVGHVEKIASYFPETDLSRVMARPSGIAV